MRYRLVIIGCLIGITFFAKRAEGCTEFLITAEDGTHVVGRSMEFGVDLESALVSQPKGRLFEMPAPGGERGLQWQNKFGYYALDVKGTQVISDGVNEVGLSAAALYLPRFAVYQQVFKDQADRAIPNDMLLHYILGNFETVDQVKQAIPEVVVYARNSAIIGRPLPLHYSVYDRSGRGIVIEYTAIGLNIYDNVVNMLTNSPAYPWHLNNLQNYLSLSPYNPEPKTIGLDTVAPAGQGFGMVGLPGDSSPPSRFVRVFTLRTAANPATRTDDAVNLAVHLLNTVDVIPGTVRPVQSETESGNQPTHADYTQWIVVKDLQSLKLYYRLYGSMSTHVIDLKQIAITPNSPVMRIKLRDDLEAIEHRVGVGGAAGVSQKVREQQSPPSPQS